RFLRSRPEDQEGEMKLIGRAAILLFMAAPVFAMETVSGMPPVVNGPPATLADLVPGPQLRSGGARPQIAAPPGYGFSHAQGRAVVINAQGKNNTFFRTDGFFSNYRAINQEVLVGFLPSGTSGVGQPAVRYMLNAKSSYLVDDFLGTGTGRLNKTGVGAL